MLRSDKQNYDMAVVSGMQREQCYGFLHGRDTWHSLLNNKCVIKFLKENNIRNVVFTFCVCSHLKQLKKFISTLRNFQNVAVLLPRLLCGRMDTKQRVTVRILNLQCLCGLFEERKP
jgi:hypothetical protein